MVVYTGGRRWRSATLSDLTAPVPPDWHAWQLRLGFHLLDAASLKAERGRAHPAAALLRLLASRRAESLPAKTSALFNRLRREKRVGLAERLARALMGMLAISLSSDIRN